jgi:hypothetical protein
VAENVRDQERRRRSEKRAERRPTDDAPSPEEAGTGGENSRDDLSGTAKRALATAATAAAVGALAGAAKSVLDRRRRSSRRRDERADDEDAQDAGGSGESATAEAEPADEHADDDTDERALPADGGEPDADMSTAARGDVDEDGSDDRGSEAERRRTPQRGVSSADAANIIERATDQVEQLLGLEPERVSGIERANGAWSVTVEVVELHRIPDSTDVLSSYLVVLDDSGDLIRVERTRRYHRSQIEEG